MAGIGPAQGGTLPQPGERVGVPLLHRRVQRLRDGIERPRALLEAGHNRHACLCQEAPDLLELQQLPARRRVRSPRLDRAQDHPAEGPRPRLLAVWLAGGGCPKIGHSTPSEGDLRYLVTGGAGFIGSHLTEALVGRGDAVTVLDDLSTGSDHNLEESMAEGGVELARGSVRDRKLVERAVASAEVVVHLAATVGVELVVRDPLTALKNNYLGTDA